MSRFLLSVNQDLLYHDLIIFDEKNIYFSTTWKIDKSETELDYHPQNKFKNR